MVQNYETNRASLDAMDQAAAIEPEVAAVRLASIRETIAVMAESIRRWYGDDEDDARIRAALLLAQMDRFLRAVDRPRAAVRAGARGCDAGRSVASVLAPRGRSRSRTVATARQLAWSLDSTYSAVRRAQRKPSTARQERPLGATAAIAGLGITDMGKVYGRTATDFAADALALALDDAGLEAADVDGLLVNANHSGEMAPTLQFSLGLTDLTLVSAMSAFGSTAGAMLQYAAQAIQSGQATVVACVYADAPLTEGGSISQSAYGGSARPPRASPGCAGLRRLRPRQLDVRAGAAAAHAPVRHHPRPARDDRGRAARVGAEEPARPDAHADDDRGLPRVALGRRAAAPLRLLPGVERRRRGDRHVRRARARPAPAAGVPARLRPGAPGDPARSGREPAIHTGAARSGELALRQAGIELDDVDVLELYDCYTYTVLVTLEDYGFCAKGEGGAFVADGRLGPGGVLPCNTGGGQLSSYYMWGFTPLSEGVIQARGHGGERQVEEHDHVLVSGNGGALNFHSTTILSPYDA